jgi:hypothetical protein
MKTGTAAAAPIANSFSTGDFTIAWTVSGPNYSNCQITVSLQGTQIESHQFTSGNPSFALPEASFGGDTLDLTLGYQPPSATANGVIQIVTMKLQQQFGGTITLAGVQLVAWDQNGNVQSAAPPRSRTKF